MLGVDASSGTLYRVLTWRKQADTMLSGNRFLQQKSQSTHMSSIDLMIEWSGSHSANDNTNVLFKYIQIKQLFLELEYRMKHRRFYTPHLDTRVMKTERVEILALRTLSRELKMIFFVHQIIIKWSKLSIAKLEVCDINSST